MYFIYGSAGSPIFILFSKFRHQSGQEFGLRQPNVDFNNFKHNPGAKMILKYATKRKFYFLAATAPYFYGSILLQALKSEIIVLLTYVYKK